MIRQRPDGDDARGILDASSSGEREVEHAPLLHRSDSSNVGYAAGPSRLDASVYSGFRTPGATISFRDVNIVHKPFCSLMRQPTLVVQSACGLFESGRLHAIADIDGAAGAALVSILLGSKLPASGTITANGVPVCSSVFRRVAGYVDTQSVAIPNITLADNLKFALRMRSDASEETGAGLVDGALALMELDSAQYARKLSRDELLRLNVAMELVIDPPIIFLNYPLDGLDAHAVFQCVACLRRVCHYLNKTVVFTTCSLPFQVFEQLDSLVMLGLDGHTLYSGERIHLFAYFSTLSLPSDMLSGPILSSDRFRRGRKRSITQSIASSMTTVHTTDAVDFTGGEQREQRSRRSNSGVAAAESPSARYARQDEDDTLVIDSGDAALDIATVWAESPATTMQYAAVFYDSPLRRTLIQRQDEVAEADQAGTTTKLHLGAFAGYRPPSEASKLWHLGKFHAQQSLLNADFYVVWFCIFVVLGATTWMMSTQTADQRGMMNERGIIFFLFFITLEANNMFVSHFRSEFHTFVLHRDGGFYSTFTYCVVLTLRTLLARVVYLITFVIFVEYVMGDMGYLVGLIAATSISHTAIVYSLVLATSSSKTASIISYLYFTYSVIFSGFLINMKTVPLVIEKTSIIRYGYGAAVAHVLRNKSYSCDAGNWTLTVNQSSYCYSGPQYLDLEGFTDDTAQANSSQLAGIAVFFFLFVFVRLWWVRDI